MAAFFPGMVLFTGAALVCFVTSLEALLMVWSTPRLAAATLYWSVATIAASPLFWNLPVVLLIGIWVLGVVLNAALLVHYFRARGTL